MTQSSPLLTIENLHVSFRGLNGSVEVLHGIDVTLYREEAFALVGESGSGKSVTAAAIMQLLGPSGTITSGEILFNGEPIHSKTQKQMNALRGSKIGMIFQDPMTSLNPTMTVGRQIAEVLTYHEQLSGMAAKQRTIQLLHDVGIGDPEERYRSYPFQLSGGMRQRVLIAMAIACKPDLLIADEPTTALDVTIQAQILDLLRGLRKQTGMSLLFITHDLALVASLCDRVAVMYQGRIVEVADVDTLFAFPQHPYTRSLLEARRTDITHAN